MNNKIEKKILKKYKRVFGILEEYDRTGKPISRIIEEKLNNSIQ